jgi:mannose-6-phosphate isomerase
MRSELRPWGTYEILYDGNDCKVKKIIVNSDQTLSYQYHHKRNEHWIVISGEGQVKIDDELRTISSGDIIFIPALAKHTITNTDLEIPLVFIEVQTGSYFGEDDIVRLEDKYGRA